MVMNRKIPTLPRIERVGSELPRPGKVGHLDVSDRRTNSKKSFLAFFGLVIKSCLQTRNGKI
jgi:hypothetical protein